MSVCSSASLTLPRHALRATSTSGSLSNLVDGFMNVLDMENSENSDISKPPDLDDWYDELIILKIAQMNSSFQHITAGWQTFLNAK